MARNQLPELYVVDGSNIATEGRSTPSLEQLNEAVLAFLDAHPDVTVTVVVDATFGHRIAKKEVKAFDEAVANNELVTPPAGAVGRGDAFVLAIADRAKAGVLSNDSFQEFHGEYDWLFDDGRLIGGKPVPHVGWVFVKRTPVRGPKSRQAVREANADAKDTKERVNRRVRKRSAAEPPSDATTDETASETTAVASEETTASSSTRRSRRGRGRKKAAPTEIGPEQQATIEAAKAATGPKEHVNDLMPFLEFVEVHPVGTSCTAVVESYASHGAYARVDDVLLYLPLRLMDDPAPRSAKSVLKIGEAVTAVIVGYVPDRRSIDAALPHMAGDASGAAVVDAEPSATAPQPDSASPGTDQSASETAAPAKKTPAKKTPAKKTPAKKTPAKKTAAKQTAAKKTPAKQTAAKKTPAKQTAATSNEPAADATDAAPAETATKTPATKTPAKQTAARQTAAKKTPAKKTPAKQTAAKKTAAKKTPAKTTAAETTAAKKPAAKQTAAKKTAAKKTAAKRAPAKRTAPKRAASAPPAVEGAGSSAEGG